MLTRDADVLIVGAGPTGLALAIALRKADLRPIIIDRLAAGQNTSRAAVIHAHTLDVLDRIDVAEALERRGLALTRATLRDHDRVLMELDFTTLPSRHAGVLMLPQDITEAILAERLEQLGGSVDRNVTATGIDAATDGAMVRLSPAVRRKIMLDMSGLARKSLGAVISPAKAARD